MQTIQISNWAAGILLSLVASLCSATETDAQKQQVKIDAAVKKKQTSQLRVLTDAQKRSRAVADEFSFARALVLANSQKPEEKVIAAQLLVNRSPFIANAEFVARLQRDLVDAGVNPLNALLLPEIIENKLNANLLKKTAHRLINEAVADPRIDIPSLWMAQRFCHKKPNSFKGEGNCDSASILDQLQRRDAENAAVWMDDLQDLVARKDAFEIDKLLEKLATTKSFKTYQLPTSWKFWQAFEAGEFPPQWQMANKHEALFIRHSRATEFIYAVQIPDFNALAQLCHIEKVQAHRHHLCIQILTVMATNSDTFLGDSVGLRQLYRMSVGTPDEAKVAEMMRVSKWRHLRQSFDDLSVLGSVKSLEQLHLDWRDYSSERSLAEARLLRQGVSPTPPDHFQLGPEELKVR